MFDNCISVVLWRTNILFFSRLPGKRETESEVTAGLYSHGLFSAWNLGELTSIDYCSTYSNTNSIFCNSEWTHELILISIMYTVQWKMMICLHTRQAPFSYFNTFQVSKKVTFSASPNKKCTDSMSLAFSHVDLCH